MKIHTAVIASSFALLAACSRGATSYDPAEVLNVHAMSESAFQQDCVRTTLEKSGVKALPRIDVASSQSGFSYYAYDDQGKSISLTAGNFISSGSWNMPDAVRVGFEQAAHQCAGTTPVSLPESKETGMSVANYTVRDISTGETYPAQYKY